MFDIQFYAASDSNSERTLFSFETETGRRCFSVELPGRPRIVAGDAVTAVLGQADNWQTLQGWRNLANGEIVVRGAVGVTGWVGAVVMFGLAFFLWRDATTTSDRTMSGLFLIVCGFAFAAVVEQQCRVWRVRRLLESL